MTDSKLKWEKKYPRIGAKKKVLMAIWGDSYSRCLARLEVVRGTKKGLWVCFVYGCNGILFATADKTQYLVKRRAEQWLSDFVAKLPSLAEPSTKKEK